MSHRRQAVAKVVDTAINETANSTQQPRQGTEHKSQKRDSQQGQSSSKQTNTQETADTTEQSSKAAQQSKQGKQASKAAQQSRKDIKAKNDNNKGKGPDASQRTIGAACAEGTKAAQIPASKSSKKGTKKQGKNKQQKAGRIATMAYALNTTPAWTSDQGIVSESEQV